LGSVQLLKTLPPAGRKREYPVIVNHNGNKRTPISCACVDRQSVVVKFRMLNRGMAMHDENTVVAIVLQEFLTDPYKIILDLIVESDTGADARMGKEQVTHMVSEMQ
jgi:hypothetical protein